MTLLQILTGYSVIWQPVPHDCKNLSQLPPPLWVPMMHWVLVLVVFAPPTPQQILTGLGLPHSIPRAS